MENFLPFSQPDIGEEEINEVIDSLRSGWLTTGPKTKQFEEMFSDFIGNNVDSVAVNSATAGLHLALEAIGVESGDEIITTPYTFTATAEVIRYFGAKPIFVDIGPDTFNIDSSKIEENISSRTKAILPVHFAGLACEMDNILNLAKKYNLKVVEDAAHALPTTYKKNIIGSLESDAVVFSFYATKTITTGEGGMIVTRNPEIASRCRVMRLHGIDRDVFYRYSSKKPSWYYEVVSPGFKYNMTDIGASLGIHQLEKAWRFQEKRNYLANMYNEKLADLPISLPPKPLEGDVHSWHLYVTQVNDSTKINRDEFIEKMMGKGIGCSVHYIPLHLHPYWKNTYNLKPEDFPNSLSLFERAVSLPLYTKMNEEDIKRVVNAIDEVLSNDG